MARTQNHELKRPFRTRTVKVPAWPALLQSLFQSGACRIHRKHQMLDDLLHAPAVRTPPGMHICRRRIEAVEFCGDVAKSGLEDWVHRRLEREFQILLQAR